MTLVPSIKSQKNILIIVGTLICFLCDVTSHIVGDKSQVQEQQKLCEHAYTCFHDTVIVCGKSVNEARTFLDLCDLYEFSCEYNMVYRHVKEEEGVCPNQKELGANLG